MFLFGLIVGLVGGGVAVAAYINNKYILKKKITNIADKI